MSLTILDPETNEKYDCENEYETDINKWKKLSVEEINSAAISLYNMSEKRLQKDRNVSDII